MPDALNRTLDVVGLSPSPQPQKRIKQVTTLEQKRIKRKILKVFDTEEGTDFTKKLRNEGEILLPPESSLLNSSIDAELLKLREKQVSPFQA